MLPYPPTFSAPTSSASFTATRANFLVSVGLGINCLILAVLPWAHRARRTGIDDASWQVLQLAAPVTLPNGSVVESEVGLFQLIYATTSGAVFASMLAYIAAQYCDVQLYHFWKRVTKASIFGCATTSVPC